MPMVFAEPESYRFAPVSQSLTKQKKVGVHPITNRKLLFEGCGDWERGLTETIDNQGVTFEHFWPQRMLLPLLLKIRVYK